MEKIKSFTINHDTLQVGMYTSRIDGDIVTYDIRLVRPNTGVYLSTGSLHTIEHPYVKPKTKKFITFFEVFGQLHSCP